MKRDTDTMLRDDSVSTQEVPKEIKGRKRRRLLASAEEFPVAPTLIVAIEKPRNVANHSYRDFSRVPPAMHHPQFPMHFDELNFPQRIHWALSNPNVFHKSIMWMPHGRAFRIRNAAWLAISDVFERIFHCRNQAVFYSKLQSWGFKHLTLGENRNCFYHELFLRGLPHLTCYFGEPRDSRRKVPDPANEPNLTAITTRYPLPSLEEQLLVVSEPTEE